MTRFFTARRLPLLLLAGAALAASTACSLTWMNVRDSSDLPGGCHVALQSHDDEDFRFAITNTSQQPVTVLVDSIKLVSPRKTISRETAHPWMGVAEMIQTAQQGASMQVAPGQTVAIYAHFDLDDAGIKSGDVVRIDFTNAILAGGAAMPVPPLEFAIQ